MNVEHLLNRIASQVEHEILQKERGYQDWILQQDVNVYGRPIPKGTIFVQVSGDYYQPVVNGARCPSYQVDFYVVKNNPEYFLPNPFIMDKGTTAH